MRIVAVCLVAGALAGCGGTSTRPPVEVFSDMDRQLKYKPQAESAFFSDGRASRRPVPGTVARGQLKEDAAFYTGSNVAKIPVTVDRDLLVRGQERFNIYCAPCHDRTGSGRGIVASRASWLATNLSDQRVKDMPDGEIFGVISQGRRTMPSYRYQIGEHDRWAIVAYVRALQRAASGTVEDVPAELRRDLR